ncbi:TPA: hypothetical protein ACRTM4_004606 [Aeromonas hydrophila]|uniref:hypothetical protein n=1 Tax=Aeromonas TaxID=642 RepID=UPI0015DD299C|nr:hypothetical protein [Aeromonas hydrophila]BBT05392.1 hypothetical protein WP7S18E06_08910 [Aeromonas hydrophila]BCK60373.1 hypothetical protein [Aeromonas hydrophila]HAU4895352.1 hypothetical protein [Aeromonas hydrophila]HAU4976262.1 hypothetical protein [Aeromonas hydrophila]HAU4985201.1 hypothetical protein [Aeromonas hydrophila]
MQEKFESLEDVAQVLGDGGPFSPDIEYETVEQLVDGLVSLGNTDEVFVNHDDHLGLKSSLSNEFLATSLSDLDTEAFSEEIEQVLEQANIIISLSARELSEEDLDDIREDRLYRGEGHDDY